MFLGCVDFNRNSQKCKCNILLRIYLVKIVIFLRHVTFIRINFIFKFILSVSRHNNWWLKTDNIGFTLLPNYETRNKWLIEAKIRAPCWLLSSHFCTLFYVATARDVHDFKWQRFTGRVCSLFTFHTLLFISSL